MVGLGTAHSEQVEHLAGVVGQLFDLGLQQRTHDGGHRLGMLRSQHPPPVVAIQRSIVHERPDQRVDEQRHATRPRREHVQESGGSLLTEQVLREDPDRLVAQSRKLQLGEGSGPAQSGEQITQGRTGLVRAVGEQHQQRSSGQAADQVVQQGQRTPVGPMHIVEQQHQRLPSRRPLQQPTHRLEQPRGSFDLIHARALLMHIPQREQILDGLVAALRPGGVLLVEDADHFPLAALDTGLYVQVFEAFLDSAGRAGMAKDWARRLPTELRRRGLHNIWADCESPLFEGGAPYSQFWRLTLSQARDLVVAQGIQPATD